MPPPSAVQVSKQAVQVNSPDIVPPHQQMTQSLPNQSDSFWRLWDDAVSILEQKCSNFPLD